MLRTLKAMRLGIHPRTWTLRDADDIEQVGRGSTRLSTAPPLSSPDLVPVADCRYAAMHPPAFVLLVTLPGGNSKRMAGVHVRTVTPALRQVWAIDVASAERADRLASELL